MSTETHPRAVQPVHEGEDLDADTYGEGHHGATDRQYILIAAILAVDHGGRGDAQLHRRRPDLPAGAADHDGGEVRHRRQLLHAPEVRQPDLQLPLLHWGCCWRSSCTASPWRRSTSSAAEHARPERPGPTAAGAQRPGVIGAPRWSGRVGDSDLASECSVHASVCCGWAPHETLGWVEPGFDRRGGGGRLDGCSVRSPWIRSGSRRTPTSGCSSPSWSAPTSTWCRRVGPHAVAPGQQVVTRRNVWCFAAAMALLWTASDWPIHDLGEQYLYSAHMLQHMMLTYFLPPLALLATPEWLLRVLVGDGRAYRVLAWLCKPVVAGRDVQPRRHHQPHPGRREHVGDVGQPGPALPRST